MIALLLSLYASPPLRADLEVSVEDQDLETQDRQSSSRS